MLHDAHFHLRDQELLKTLRQYDIHGIVNAQNPKEYEKLKACLTDISTITISAGIHPWDVDTLGWEDMLPIMEEAAIIGEIGLDSVWCSTNPHKQQELFERSLIYAHDHHKPVILHTKGRERQVLAGIRKYSNTYLVHWYSCVDALPELIDLGCYFTVGPSVGKDPAVDRVATMVPLDHLMIETDGLAALSWCEQREVKAAEYIHFLRRSIAEIARLRHMSVAETTHRLNLNFRHFLSLAVGRNGQ